MVMAYLTSFGSLTAEQTDALLDIDPMVLRSLPIGQRVELALQHAGYEARKREAFWTAVEGIATGMLPILAFLGITAVWGK